jgi:hypothetical protein
MFGQHFGLSVQTSQSRFLAKYMSVPAFVTPSRGLENGR